MMLSKHFLWGLLLVIITAGISSCRKDPVISDSTAKLAFSADTVIFDTVFTTIGSSTRHFKIYNDHNRRIRISSIRLAGGTSSLFRLNVDGMPGVQFGDIEIPPDDSIFVFVEVTINPNNSNSPLIVTDSIIFETNGNIQDVDLVAWGQDANFFYPKYYHPLIGPFDIADCPGIWTDLKPYVIYGTLVVDSACSLEMQAGARIHFHRHSRLWIYSGGTLKIRGTKDKPVTIQGDRLERLYKDVPGQWDRIWLSAGSIDNEIDFAIIKNGNVGLQVDTVGHHVNPTLVLTNTIIQNMDAAAIFAQGSKIEAYNCVFANCGQYVAALTIGGDYRFRHCSFANYWTWDTRQTPALLLNNYYKDIHGNFQIRPLTNAYFGNCIIYGSLAGEIGFDSKTGALFEYRFDHCLIKIDPAINTNTANYVSITKNIGDHIEIFEKVTDNNYELKNTSPAINKGSASITNAAPPIANDIKGQPRIAGPEPDLGAYESQ